MTDRDRTNILGTQGTGGGVRAWLIATAMMLLIILTAQPADAQFGQNKVNYQDFDWYYIQTDHFDIYHPKGAYKIAEFAGWEAEAALKKIEKDWDYKLQGRVTFVVYPSQNTFQSNNVGFSEQDESTGGFTEFLKNRVVIPFQGSYDMFRHVIHHELTHAVMLRMLYGEGVQSIITGVSRLPVPLWYTEGMAEYESLGGWNNDADMYMRDAIVNDYLPPINRLGGYFNYKGGQSVLYYLQERYGKKKIGELMRRIRSKRDFNRALKEAVGVNLEDLSKRWHRHLQRQIWPSSAQYEAPEDFAEKVTDHLKAYNFINTSPALSPEGDRLVMLSDKDDYMSIYLVNTVTGEIIRRVIKSGASVYLFEQLLWLRPWIDWSPDGTQISFVAETAGRDVLFTLNVDSGEITGEYRYKFDGLFSPTWSPDGKQIAFSAYQKGQSDIYLVDVGKPGSVRKLTDDVFSDYDPDWGSKGTILFTSDRGEEVGSVGKDYEMWNHNFHQIDTYLIDPSTRKISRLTNDAYEERTPTWTSRPDTISFVSDRTGAYNLYMMDVNTGKSWAVTDVLTGVFTPSWSKRGTVAFASFYHGGYDIYLYKDPFDPDRRKNPELTYFQKVQRGLIKDIPFEDSQADSLAKVNEGEEPDQKYAEDEENEITQPIEIAEDDTTSVPADSSMTDVNTDPSGSTLNKPTGSGGIKLISELPRQNSNTVDSMSVDTLKTASAEKDTTQGEKEQTRRVVDESRPQRRSGVGYENYIFLSDGMQNQSTVVLDEEKPDSIFDESGHFIQKKYKLKFTPDLMYATAGYSSYFGFQGYGQMMFSDVLGNNVIFFGTDLYYNFENSNFTLYYLNLPHRYDWGAGIFNTVYYFNYGNIRDRNYGAMGEFVYPLSKTKRFDLSARFVNIDRDIWDWQYQYDYIQYQKRHFFIPTLSYVSDNSLWGWTAPMTGMRYRIDFTYSPKFSNTQSDSAKDLWGVDFKTVGFDGRKYFHLGRDYAFGLRLAGAASFGEHPQKFFLGGVDNWLNYRFNGGIRVNIDDIYFSQFVTPLRGANYYDKIGNRYVLANAEFRFPLVRQLLLGWPLPFYFTNIRGIVFSDLGAAWNDNNFRGMIAGDHGQTTFGSIALGYGWGARIGLGFALLRFDMAWRNEWDHVSKPSYYWSFGFDL